MFRCKEIPVPVYGGTLCVIDTNSWDSVRSRYKDVYFGERQGELWGAYGHYAEGTKKGYLHAYYFLIFNMKGIMGAEGLTGMFDYIAHEAVHVKNFLFVKCGVLHCQSNDETEAHMVGWIAAEASRFLLAEKKEKILV